jgi:hypothetical protein
VECSTPCGVIDWFTNRAPQRTFPPDECAQRLAASLIGSLLYLQVLDRKELKIGRFNHICIPANPLRDAKWKTVQIIAEFDAESRSFCTDQALGRVVKER